jgi:endonuclease/exonuclease/phosphatase family metal-dependent hydrolase
MATALIVALMAVGAATLATGSIGLVMIAGQRRPRRPLPPALVQQYAARAGAPRDRGGVRRGRRNTATSASAVTPAAASMLVAAPTHAPGPAPAPAPGSGPGQGSGTGGGAPDRLRVRVANAHMHPLGVPIGRNARIAVAQGLFAGTDVVLLQEAWRPLALARGRSSDPVHALQRAAGPNVQFAVDDQSRVPFGKVTDSGLAAAAVAPWHVKFVGSRAFTHADTHTSDSLSCKGTAVFEVWHEAMSTKARSIRLATVHMQASYKTRGGHDALRQAQFQEAIDYCIRLGVVVIAGDFNTHDPGELAAMDAYVARATGGTGYRGAFRRVDPAKPQLDHVWYLGGAPKRAIIRGAVPPSCADSCSVTINARVADVWTDHDSLEFDLIIE